MVSSEDVVLLYSWSTVRARSEDGTQCKREYQRVGGIGVNSTGDRPLFPLSYYNLSTWSGKIIR